MKNWYLLQTKARQEFIAEENLARQEYRVYLPIIKQARKIRSKWQEITEPFFPGYLFIHLDMEAQNTSTIRSTRGVLKLVKFGEETPQVPDDLVEGLRTRLLESAEEKVSLPFSKGEKVLITDGCFSGLQAIFQCETGRERVVLLLDLLGKLNRIELAKHQVAPFKDI